MVEYSVFTCALYLYFITLGLVIGSHCPCSSMNGCQRPRHGMAVADKEVFVVTDGKSDYTTWHWDSLTAVLVTEEVEKTDVMCYAHQHGKRYGFMASMTYDDHFDVTSNNTKKWISSVVKRAIDNVADMVAVNLIDVLSQMGQDQAKTFGKALSALKQAMIPTIHKSVPIELVCIVPWKPPCFGDRCNIKDDTLYHVCDWAIIDASSFEIIDSMACKARATVPYTHLAIGVDEYANVGISENRIILGVPWHGFSYTCATYQISAGQDGICELPKKDKTENNKTVSYCDVKGAKTKITIGEIVEKHASENSKSTWSKIYEAPVYTRFDNKTKVFHQVWYENIRSLRMKYQYAHDFDLKGIAIYNAEDLVESDSAATKGLIGGMWDWVLHGILQTTVKQPPPVKYHSEVVAGAAIGCLLLGLILGVVFTCLALRHRVKKQRQMPFKSDQVEYHDDDDNLHL